MNLIKLLFKLRKTLKGLGDERNIVIELSKKDNSYVIKKMYTEQKADSIKSGSVEFRPDTGLYINDGMIDCSQVTELQKQDECRENRFK